MAPPSSYAVFAGRSEWRAWLEQHHADTAGLWLTICKVGSGKVGLTYDEAVEEALCFGWIDGQLQRIDGTSCALRFTPRKLNSVWAESNKRRVEKLIRQGRMAESGLKLVAAAQASGQWEAAARREEVDTLPPELEQALRQVEGALAGFQALSPSRRKQLVWWVTDAKRDTTRQKRPEAVVAEALARGGVPVSPPWRGDRQD